MRGRQRQGWWFAGTLLWGPRCFRLSGWSVGLILLSHFSPSSPTSGPGLRGGGGLFPLGGRWGQKVCFLFDPGGRGLGGLTARHTAPLPSILQAVPLTELLLWGLSPGWLLGNWALPIMNGGVCWFCLLESVSCCGEVEVMSPGQEEGGWSVWSLEKWKNPHSPLLSLAFQLTTRLAIDLFALFPHSPLGQPPLPAPSHEGPGAPAHWGPRALNCVQPFPHFLYAGLISFMTGARFRVCFYLEHMRGHVGEEV